MNIFLAGDTSRRANWGCRATSHALKVMLSKEHSIAYSLDFSELRKLIEPKYSARAKVFNRLKLYRKDYYPTSFDHFDYFADKFQQKSFLPSISNAVEKSDLVVINGEGSFRKEGKNFPAIMSLFLSYASKKCFSKPCIIVNHTADLRNNDIKKIAQHVYPLFDDIGVREPISLRSLQNLFGFDEEKLTLAADAVFTYYPEEKQTWAKTASRPNYFGFYPFNANNFNPLSPYICVGGSAALHPIRRKGHNPLPSFLELCKRLNNIYPVVLVAACSGDEDFMQEASKELSLPVLGTSMPTYQAVDVLGNAELYVGGRWHSCIKAVTGGTPIIVFSSNTNYKSEGILEIMNLSYKPYDSFNIEAEVDSIGDQAMSLLSQSKVIREKLFARAQELSVSALDNVRFLKKL